MSTAPAHGPRDPEQTTEQQADRAPRPKPALDFGDPLDQQSADDTDRGWGERPPGSGGSAADLARFLDEKPPHHL
ncbi:hypothetical protein [Streptomyces chryseus]